MAKNVWRKPGRLCSFTDNNNRWWIYGAGHTFSNDGDVQGNHGGMDWWVIKIDATGTLVWQKCLGGSSDDQANSIQSTAKERFLPRLGYFSLKASV